MALILLLLASLAQAKFIESGRLHKLDTSNSTSMKIGFGSCYDGMQLHAEDGLNIMEDISKEDLDLWVWLGDFAYVDKKILKRKATYWERFQHLTVIQKIPFSSMIFGALNGFLYVHEEDRRHLFNMTFSNKYYSRLRQSTPVVGIWDDHDYGVNDGDASCPIKIPQKQIYLDYMEEPMYSDRRQRGDEHGIYTHYRFEKTGYKVLLLLLDIRYERDFHGIFSETQWRWLENTLSYSAREDDLILIGSGIQFIMNNRLVNAEHWNANDVKRLLQLLRRYIGDQTQVVFMSGDVHHAQFLSSKCHLSDALLGDRFFEVTSSGLTHTCDRNLFRMCDYALRGNTPDKFQDSDLVVEHNYGIIDIEFGKQEIEISIKGRQNRTLLQKSLLMKKQKTKAFEYCDNYIFGRSVVIFEKFLKHVPMAILEAKNKFLMAGILVFTIALSGVLTVLILGTNRFIRRRKSK